MGRSDVQPDLPRLHPRLGDRLQRLPVARKRRLRGACARSEGYTWHRTYGAWLGAGGVAGQTLRKRTARIGQRT